MQEAKLSRAMVDLKSAQATLDEKQKQLDEVQVGKRDDFVCFISKQSSH